MFENKFNSKKSDPLVEAVKVAQQDGVMRRQAEAHVNEQFGVYSRNAVVRENLAAYDAALEEAYKCMKEGKPLSPKQEKMAAIAGDPKKIDSADLSALRSGKKMNEKKGCYEEGNDGNLANNYPPYDKVTRGDVIAGRLGKDQMGGKKKVDEKKGCYEEEQIDEVKSGQPSFRGDSTKRARRIKTAQQKAPKDPEFWKKVDVANKKREAQIDEVSLAKASKTARLRNIGAERDAHASPYDYSPHIDVLKRKAGKTVDRIEKKHGADAAKRVSGKMNKDTDKVWRGKYDEEINEATRKHFVSHAADIAKISDQGERNKAASAAADTYSRLNKRFDHAKFHKAAGSTAHETKTVKESVLAAIRAKYMKEDENF